MSTTAPIPSVPPVTAPAPVAPAPTSGPDASQGSETQAEAQADLRLVIEEDKAAGSYVYLTVDPISGKVISQVPREELLKMREASDYRPGSIVNSRS